MPTIEQIRAARALLDWSQSDLADRAGLSQTGIARIENGTNQPNSSTLAKIEAAFEGSDIEFLGTSGVRRNKGEIKRLRGRAGLIELMNNILEVGRTEGGLVCLFNAKPSNWFKWIEEEWFQNYSAQMAALSPHVQMRITAVEGDHNFVSKRHAEYRWFPKNLFYNESKSFYIYGNKLAFINFFEEDVEILVLTSPEFAEGVRSLFNIAWDHVAIKPPAKAA